MSLHHFAAVCLLAFFAATGVAQPRDAQLVEGPAASASVAGQIEAAQAALDQRQLELAGLRQAISDLEVRMRRVERRANVHALGGEFAQTLVEDLRRLPTPEHFAAARKRRAELMAAASDAELQVERALNVLNSGASAYQLAPLAPLAAAEQIDAFKRLASLLTQNLEALQEADKAGHDLEHQSTAAQARLAGYLFWIPAPSAAKTLGWFMPALAWSASPVNWRAAVAQIEQSLERRPMWPALSMLAVVALLALRRPMRRALVSLSPEAVTWGRYRMGYAMAAVAITFALALPVPLLLWTGSTLLSTAQESQDFVLALASAMRAVAVVLLGLSVLGWLIGPDGLAIRHFGRSGASLSAAAQALRRFTTPFVLLLFVAVLNMVDHAPYTNRESLGRLAFGLTLLANAVFLARHLHRTSPLVQGLAASASGSWTLRLHPVWFGAVVAGPLVGFAFAAAGYSVAAAYFWQRTVNSVFLMIGALVLYGMVALWVKLQHLHHVHSEASDQARSLLDFLVTLLLLAALWRVWRDAMPALESIGDYALWSSTGSVDGKSGVHVLTLGQLFRAILVGVFTGIAVSRVGALVDIVLLHSLRLQQDATYAIKAITRYSLAAAGMLLACSILGIAWDDVQWLIAALGVGLGFGLQEIVANFVSGLIVLAERPIRIGDVVTVDKISGTVARIRARATVVIDFDNKEVIIPNKAFITGPVINWTLSSQISRLVLKVGVPYGADIARVQERLVEEVRLVPGVVPDPPPAVFFTAFADKTLDFEIHACVGSVNDRLEVQHQINLVAERVLREQGRDRPPS